jgi:hypothetical protein
MEVAMNSHGIRLLGAVLICLFALSASAEPLTAEQQEEWLFDDSDSLIDEVNEGALVFLDEPPARVVHHHANRVVISQESIDEGWVQLSQCHTNLDKVSQAQIVFRPDRVRKLKVTSVKNIAGAWVEGASVQLRDIADDAKLCIDAETRVFVYNGDGTFSLRSGPYMRRFLDGFYPMRVSMQVTLATDKLRFADISPVIQKGFTVVHKNGTINYDAWFEGRLNTEIRFFSEGALSRADEERARGMIADLEGNKPRN